MIIGLKAVKGLWSWHSVWQKLWTLMSVSSPQATMIVRPSGRRLNPSRFSSTVPMILLPTKKTRKKLKEFGEHGFGEYPVCIAKTQYSFSTDPQLLGAPSGHVVPIKDVMLSAGAEFVVVICGGIMRMPGLPREPSANHICINDDEMIEGLF